jgi:hypothetical protein
MSMITTMKCFQGQLQRPSSVEPKWKSGLIEAQIFPGRSLEWIGAIL